ncbi:hypothetical protein Ddc_00147 [Ditylenchus destructor]|nr:hypothetical protein Ddc_00147 [Ditylenchus destructor]
MNVLKKIFKGKKDTNSEKNQDNSDNENDHCHTDFDKTFEEARRVSAIIPQIKRECEYRGSPSRGRNSRSKSPSPFPQNSKVKQMKNASSGRKGSEPLNMPSNPSDKMRRNMRESQRKRAKEMVESMDWMRPTESSTSSNVTPQIAHSQMITPQICICEALPIAKPKRAKAVIPERKTSSLATPGRMVVAANLHP